MCVNTKYKDSVFSFLFSEPSVLLELFCALESVDLPPDTPVTINTLSEVLFLDRVNDISFEIEGKIVVLIEHQSTINPNMALRLLMYISRVYEKIIGEKNIYASRKLTLPRPEFFVLYNGTDPYPEESILKLSDMFDEITSMGLKENKNFALELTVKVLNINHGKNSKIIEKSKTLAGYSVFVHKVREYQKEKNDLKEAIKKAIQYCHQNDILKNFFEKNASEVSNMLMTEWNWDDALAFRYEEGREEGREEGIVSVARKALSKGFSLETIQEITGFDLETIKNIKG